MFALRRSDVADLNHRARIVMSDEGRLGSAELVVGENPFAVGDEILTTRNNRRLGLLNGTLGSVTKVDLDAQSLSIRTNDGRDRVIPADYLAAGHVTHAYAVSIHKAQGMTCDTALLLGDDPLYLEAGYTEMSRGRYENRLYVVAGDDDVEHHGAARDNHDIVQTLRRSAAQEGATTVAERSRQAADIGLSR